MASKYTAPHYTFYESSSWWLPFRFKHNILVNNLLWHMILNLSYHNCFENVNLQLDYSMWKQEILIKRHKSSRRLGRPQNTYPDLTCWLRSETGKPWRSPPLKASVFLKWNAHNVSSDESNYYPYHVTAARSEVAITSLDQRATYIWPSATRFTWVSFSAYECITLKRKQKFMQTLGRILTLLDSLIGHIYAHINQNIKVFGKTYLHKKLFGADPFRNWFSLNLWSQKYNGEYVSLPHSINNHSLLIKWCISLQTVKTIK
jgi:hypothetical protein